MKLKIYVVIQIVKNILKNIKEMYIFNIDVV